MTFVYNADQATALELLRVFMAGPERKFVLVGAAGTGKTSVVQRYIYEQVVIWRRRVAICAPTNKAVKVLYQMGQSMGHDFASAVVYGTIYKLLGLKMRIDQRTGKLEFLPDPKNPPVLDDYDIIVCDEGSMLDSTLYDLLRLYTPDHVKIIFIGDPCQLPPVGETMSQVFDVPNQVTLTQIMRHGGGIERLVGKIRTNIDNPAAPFIQNDHGEVEGVWNLRRDDWLRRMVKDFTSPEFQEDPNYVRSIAYTNRVVDWGNLTIQQAIYGENSPYFVIGQRLVARNPVFNESGDVVMTTSSECTILEAEWCEERGYQAWRLMVRTEEGDVVQIRAVDIESREQFRSDLENIRERAINSTRGWDKKNLWDAYWSWYQYFADVDYIYWLTAHKSQGSTFQRVFIAYGDIKSNKCWAERNKCIYTAATRPSQQLIAQEY